MIAWRIHHTTYAHRYRFAHFYYSILLFFYRYIIYVEATVPSFFLYLLLHDTDLGIKKVYHGEPFHYISVAKFSCFFNFIL